MFELKILTPEGIYDEVEIDSLTLPSVDGQRTILSDHMAIVIPIQIGVMFYKINGKKENFFVSEGLFTFENNQANLLVNSIENEKEIDFNRAERAKERALKRIQDQEEFVDVKRAELALKRSLNRLRLKK